MLLSSRIDSSVITKIIYNEYLLLPSNRFPQLLMHLLESIVVEIHIFFFPLLPMLMK